MRSITLHHQYVYPAEVRIWLEQFIQLDLTREQKTIVRLGYGEHIISAKEIWDAVGIQDTHHYNELLQSLRSMNILESTMNHTAASNLARRRGINRKEVQRFKINPPNTKYGGYSNIELEDEGDFAKIFVTNIPWDIQKEELFRSFETFGEIADVSIPVNRETGKSKGFAFVEFENLQSATDAIAASGSITLKGRCLWVQKYETRD